MYKSFTFTLVCMLKFFFLLCFLKSSLATSKYEVNVMMASPHPEKTLYVFFFVFWVCGRNVTATFFHFGYSLSSASEARATRWWYQQVPKVWCVASHCLRLATHEHFDTQGNVWGFWQSGVLFTDTNINGVWWGCFRNRRTSIHMRWLNQYTIVICLIFIAYKCQHIIIKSALPSTLKMSSRKMRFCAVILMISIAQICLIVTVSYFFEQQMQMSSENQDTLPPNRNK